MWNLIKKLIGGSGSSPIGELALTIREAIKGKEVDPNEALRMINELNKAEAEHRSIFVAGWRPFIGWVCGVAFAAHYIVIPIIATYTVYEIPDFDTNSLFTVLMGMLGLGGLRTYEKLKDKSK